VRVITVDHRGDHPHRRGPHAYGHVHPDGQIMHVENAGNVLLLAFYLARYAIIYRKDLQRRGICTNYCGRQSPAHVRAQAQLVDMPVPQRHACSTQHSLYLEDSMHALQIIAKAAHGDSVLYRGTCTMLTGHR